MPSGIMGTVWESRRRRKGEGVRWRWGDVYERGGGVVSSPGRMYYGISVSFQAGHYEAKWTSNVKVRDNGSFGSRGTSGLHFVNIKQSSREFSE